MTCMSVEQCYVGWPYWLIPHLQATYLLADLFSFPRNTASPIVFPLSPSVTVVPVIANGLPLPMSHRRDSKSPDEKLPKRYERILAQTNEERARQEQARKEKWADKVREEAGSALPVDGSQPSNDVPEQSGDSGGPDVSEGRSFASRPKHK